MNNYIDSARAVYRSIPFITPALKTDLQGNYKCDLDARILNNRTKFWVVGTASLASLAVKFSSVTVLAGSATPLVLTVGIVASMFFVFLFDNKLTYRAANNLAIKQYLNSDNPPESALDWLLADMSRIKLLLKNVDLSERDSFVNTLMKRGGSRQNERFGGLRGFSNLMLRAARDADTELLCLFWNQCNGKDKEEAFTTFLAQVCRSEKECCKQNLDFLIDNKMILPEMFTNQQQFNLMYLCLVDLMPTANSLKYLEKLNDLGFSIDAKNDKNQSIRDFISYFIFRFALDNSSLRKFTIKVGKKKSVLRAIHFLQDYENKKSGLLVEKPALEVEEVWTEDKLENVAPYLTNALTESLDMFQQACKDDNVKIGSILWDKTNVAERKNAFRTNLFWHPNPKLAISLMKGAQVTSTMFTEEEQNHLFLARFIGSYLNNHENLECVNLLLDLGFNIRAKHAGKPIRDTVVEAITYSTKKSDYLIKSLDVLDNILKKQNITAGVVLKQGQISEKSNLSMFPDDILNYIVQTMVATH